MNKTLAKVGLWLGLFLTVWLSLSVETQAKTNDTMKAGIYAGDIALEGMTKEEAAQAIQDYVDSLASVEITLIAANNNQVVCLASDMGISWSNPEILDEAALLGKQGNIVKRYKDRKDLEHENKIYPIFLDFDINAINAILTEKCAKYDQNAIDMKLARKDGSFSVIDGQAGYSLDIETSIDAIYDFLTGDWNREACQIPLDVIITEPRGTREELAKVKDVLGTFTTSYTSSGTSRSANVANGCKLINGTTVYPGEEFSAYETVSPFSEANGYYMAGSYLSGKVVDSLGGGICQVSTTLYNAVLLSELEVTQRYNHSMVVSYVDPSADAAIAESSGKDFKFVNNTDYPIYIEGYTEKKHITFTIYGVETRPASHSVEYVSEIIEQTQPSAEVLYPDSSQPVGYVDVTGAHIGYKAKLWKVTKENGVEVSREQVNSSTYKMAPRSAIVGVATSDPNAYNEIMAAIGTNSIDHVKTVAAMLKAGQIPAPAPVETPTE